MVRQLVAGILTSAMLFSTSAFAETCSKKDARDSVEKICKLIEAKGEGAKEEIKAHRHCGTNYVWVQDTTKEVKMVIHPTNPRLNGKSLTGFKDESGFPLFVEFDKTAKAEANGGWVDYLWAKPGAEKATAKISFVKLCPGPLKWIAGSGIWKE